ncbi:MAG: hypothetical protein FWG41_00835 [Methanomassiliicoccaceae archaeon]|nr:hypothetical protein [Methanomassiliicoccaceae archaeon]
MESVTASDGERTDKGGLPPDTSELFTFSSVAASSVTGTVSSQRRALHSNAEECIGASDHVSERWYASNHVSQGGDLRENEHFLMNIYGADHTSAGIENYIIVKDGGPSVVKRKRCGSNQQYLKKNLFQTVYETRLRRASGGMGAVFLKTGFYQNKNKKSV